MDDGIAERATLAVLAVDDRPMVLEALKMLLQFDGHEVTTAADANEALSLFKPGRFDVVFTDFDMPGMNGHELATILKSREPAMPIIMVSAHADSVRGGSLPAVNRVLGKPWTLDEIREAIEMVLPAAER